MKRKIAIGRLLGGLLLSGLALIAAVPATAQDTTLVIDGNLFWDNDGGSYQARSGGLTCPGGAYTVTQLATVKFTHNQTVDPLLNPQVYNDTNPRWDPQVSSPALAGNPGSMVLKASDLDPWFMDVCYAGAVPYTGGIDANDWTAGWTYYNLDGGLGRTDIDTTKTVVTVNTDINANTTWTSNNNYLLVGRISVNPPATLTIEPGTVILGSGVGSYLVIRQGATIDAQGTRALPIIFTSGARWQEGQQAPADWGGVVILGTAQANCAPNGSNPPVNCAVTTALKKCVSEGDATLVFGGDNDDDNSGIMRYCRIEYSGFEVAPNNELNCLTMDAVGRGTTMEYIQCHAGSDDLFEWFGGTATLRYAVATAGQDDNYDWQMGFRGKVQFAVCRQVSGLTGIDKGIEADNNEFNFDCPLQSSPMLANLTLVGTGPAIDGAKGIHLRRGTGGKVINSIVAGWHGTGLDVENEQTFANCAGTAPSLLNCDVLAVQEPVAGFGQLLVKASPNPIVGATRLSFSLPRDQDVRVEIYDIAGRLVQSLADGFMGAGYHEMEWDARRRPAGLYFYRVRTSEGETTGKLVVSR